MPKGRPKSSVVAVVPTFFPRDTFSLWSALRASWVPLGSSWAAFGRSKIDLAARKQENQLYDQLYGRFLASRTQNEANRKVDCNL